MTTTSALFDLDELKDLNEAATPAPWQVDFAISDGTHEISAAPDVLLCYCVGTDHDVTLIVKMRNALPALLDELAKLRREVADANLYGHEMAGKVVDLCRDMGMVQGERDAAREELAKTRAELDEARKVIACRDAALDASTETHRIAQQIVLATLGANPATTAEPTTSTASDPSNIERRRCPYCCTSNDGRAIPIFDGEYVIHLTGAGGRCSGSLKSLRALPPLDADTAEPDDRVAEKLATMPRAERPITARWPRIPGNDTVALHDCGGDPRCCGTPGDHDAAEPAGEPKADDWRAEQATECGRGVLGDWCRRPVNHDGDWEDGPHLSKRTVTRTDWEPVTGEEQAHG